MLLVRNLSDFTIDGTGATLQFAGSGSGVAISNVQRLRLVGMTIDYDVPTSASGVVVETGGYKTIKLDPNSLVNLATDGGPKVTGTFDIGSYVPMTIMFGDGTQVYDFIHVTDVARANILGMKADCADENFNIGMGVGTTINELVHILLELAGSSLQIDYRPQAQSFVTHRIGSTEKAKQLLGFTAGIPLREGLRSVLDWRQRHRAGVPLQA